MGLTVWFSNGQKEEKKADQLKKCFIQRPFFSTPLSNNCFEDWNGLERYPISLLACKIAR
jgi:hypothetical protein